MWKYFNTDSYKGWIKMGHRGHFSWATEVLKVSCYWKDIVIAIEKHD